jgi:hypothetical protein
LYQADSRPTLKQRLDLVESKAKNLTTAQMVGSYGV